MSILAVTSFSCSSFHQAQIHAELRTITCASELPIGGTSHLVSIACMPLASSELWEDKPQMSRTRMIPFPHPNTVRFKLTVHKDSSADSNRDMGPDWNCPSTRERTLCPVHTVLCPVVSLSHPCCLSVLSVLSLVVTNAITSLLDLPKGKKSIWENWRILNIF